MNRPSILAIGAHPIGDGIVNGDAFPARYEIIVRALQGIGTVQTLLVAGRFSRTALERSVVDDLIVVDGPPDSRSRVTAYRQVVEEVSSMLVETDAVRRRINEIASRREVDLVVGLHPWSERYIPSRLMSRTVLVAEEDLAGSTDTDVRGESQLVRIRQRMLSMGVSSRRRLRGPANVAVICTHELPWARSLYPAANANVWPHVLGDHWYTDQPAAARLDNPICMGLFSAERNARGLREVTDAMDDGDLPIHLYGPRPHPLLNGYIGTRIDYRGETDDPVATYDRYRTTLVPAFDVSGVKTQVLQGWARGHVVVASEIAASSVGGDVSTLLTGRSGVDLARTMSTVLRSWPETVSRNGAAAARRTRTPQVLGSAVRATVVDVVQREHPSHPATLARDGSGPGT